MLVGGGDGEGGGREIAPGSQRTTNSDDSDVFFGGKKKIVFHVGRYARLVPRVRNVHYFYFYYKYLILEKLQFYNTSKDEKFLRKSCPIYLFF